MLQTAAQILGEDNLVKLRQPIAQARGLPTTAYTSQEFFDLEQKQLFPKTWMSVAFTEDIAELGDAVPVTAAGVPIIILRAQNGDVRAFHNVCRHRATIVLQEPAKGLKHLQCLYHAWTYGLDGTLEATPYFDGTPTRRGRILISLSMDLSRCDAACGTTSFSSISTTKRRRLKTSCNLRSANMRRSTSVICAWLIG